MTRAERSAARRVLPCAIALAASTLTAQQAAAARPIATDDAGVLARADCEAELYATRLNLHDVGSESAASAQLGCGVGADTQLALGYGRSNRPDADNGSRKEAVAATAKLRLLETTGGDSIALAAGSVMGRTGSGQFQFDSVNVYGIWTGAVAEGLTGHANLGWARSRSDAASRTTWNLALEYRLRPGLDAGIEWYGDDRSRPWLGLGLRWALSERMVFGASYAAQSASLRQRLMSAGVTLGF